MGDIVHTLSVALPYKFSVLELEEFCSRANQNGLDQITWHADQGSQMEPSQLRLTATDR